MTNVPRIKDSHEGWEYDRNKVDEMVLALLHLNKEYHHKDIPPSAWKSHCWNAMNRLHAKGYISNPVNTNKSVNLTTQGDLKSKELFEKYFSSAR